MNKLNKIKLMTTAVIVAVIGFTGANAQNLVNGPNSKFENLGTVIFNNDNATITNDAPVQTGPAPKFDNSAGTLQFLGTNNVFNGTVQIGLGVANRIQGLVSYASANAQALNAAYYTNLENINAGPKSIPDQVFIGGDYTASGGARTYAGTLYYDGAADQLIAGEFGGNAYNNVEMQNAGLKTLTSSADVNGTLELNASTNGGGMRVTDAGTTLAVDDNFISNVGAGDFTIDGDAITILNGDASTIDAIVSVNDGSLNLQGTSNTTVQGVGELNIATDGALDMQSTSLLNVDAAFTNANIARTNMTFAIGSSVDYQDGASSILATVATNPYGNVVVSKSDATITSDAAATDDDIYIAGDFTLNGGQNVDMYDSGVDKTMYFPNTASTLTYAGAEEVVGRVNRTIPVAHTGALTYNNSGTVIDFTTGPGAAGFFEVSTRPGTDPENYDDTRDLKRKTTLNYDIDGWVADVRAGYIASDVDADNNWVAGYDESQLRFYESEGVPTSEVEKMSTGNAYARETAAAMRWVELAGFTPTTDNVDGNPDSDFLSGNDLVYRAGPAIWYSIAGGRWSNPATWDEGTEPPTEAEVHVRHNVHAGYVRAIDDWATPEAFAGVMATKILIIEPTTTFPNPTLMIGRDGTHPGVDFATSTTPVAGITEPGRITIEGLGANSEALPTGWPGTMDIGAADNFRAGLVIYGNATNSTGIAQITASETLINNGMLNVAGILAIGQ